MSAFRNRAQRRLIGLALIVLTMLIAPASVAWAQSNNAALQGQQPSCVSFQQTGQYICNGFLRFWQANGGLAIFGYPITAELSENNLTVQYFQRARFEWHPGSNAAQWDVELGQLGTEARAIGNPDLAHELDLLRATVAPFKDVEVAKNAGWTLQSGVDYCFVDPGVGGMGYHYINASMLDTSVDPLKPEAMVYQRDANGNLTLGAVEWLVPIAAWDAEAHGQLLPEVMGVQFHALPQYGLYVLHAWIFKDNPAGMFDDWHPDVTCP